MFEIFWLFLVDEISAIERSKNTLTKIICHLDCIILQLSDLLPYVHTCACMLFWDRNLLDNEEFVAAGHLKTEESIIHGADGKPYKSRADVIDIDEELTEALLVTRDPIMPLVDEMKQSRSRSAATTSNEPKFNSQSGSISSRDSRLHGSHIVHDKMTSSEQLGMSRQRNNTPQSSTIRESDDIGKPST